MTPKEGLRQIAECTMDKQLTVVSSVYDSLVKYVQCSYTGNMSEREVEAALNLDPHVKKTLTEAQDLLKKSIEVHNGLKKYFEKIYEKK